MKDIMFCTFSNNMHVRTLPSSTPGLQKLSGLAMLEAFLYQLQICEFKQKHGLQNKELQCGWPNLTTPVKTIAQKTVLW